MQTFGGTNKEYYGIFLYWIISRAIIIGWGKRIRIRGNSFSDCYGVCVMLMLPWHQYLKVHKATNIYLLLIYQSFNR